VSYVPYPAIYPSESRAFRYLGDYSYLQAPGGWKLSGKKRWIGNGTFADVTGPSCTFSLSPFIIFRALTTPVPSHSPVVWARDTDTNKVKAFIIEKVQPCLARELGHLFVRVGLDAAAAPSTYSAFAVQGSPGHFTEKIENKIALRCVQNADITLKDCFVPDRNWIPGVKSFADTAKASLKAPLLYHRLLPR
jgi:acyl-CoA oxidase